MTEPPSGKVPAVSILTVVRNYADGLTRTYESTKAQRWTDWEMIIKDGNSTDGTTELAASLVAQDPRVRMAPGKDHNLYDAMNIALSEARGEFVLVLNSGDIFNNDAALGRAIDRIRQSDPVPDIAYFATQMELISGRSYVRPAKPVDYIHYGQVAVHQSTLIRTALHHTQLYDHETYPNIADYVAVARMAAAGAVCARYDDLLATFEITEESSSFRNQAGARLSIRAT